ncbi:hypothetical protein LSH36_58g18079 [Paralvinella palmiformis]|uniref:Uncharacterized protein n=1 Tax=Paralvinella palmiformis TaxID=53620 RepID=A0AAD9NDS8_9ANNE|nr:hypothetical protein LSH36_58g18079 [Paralvinella palmiformis]
MYLFGIFTEIRVTGFQSHALSDSNQPIRMPHGSFHLNHFHPSRSVRHCYNLLGAIHPNSVMIRGKMASRHLGNGETGIGVSVLIPVRVLRSRSFRHPIDVHGTDSSRRGESLVCWLSARPKRKLPKNPETRLGGDPSPPDGLVDAFIRYRTEAIDWTVRCAHRKCAMPNPAWM